MRFVGPIVLALAACAPKDAPPPQVVVLPAAPVAPEDRSPAAALLTGAGHVALLPSEAQAAEIAAAEQALARSGLVSDRLRLALLLSLAAPEHRDPARVRTLLQQAPFDGDQGAYEGLARLLLALAEEREGRAADRAAAAARLAEEQAVRRELEEQVQVVEELRRRLDALKALETGGAR